MIVWWWACLVCFWAMVFGVCWGYFARQHEIDMARASRVRMRPIRLRRERQARSLYLVRIAMSVIWPVCLVFVAVSPRRG